MSTLRKLKLPPENPKVLTLAEVGVYLHVHPSTIHRLLRQGKLPGFRIGSDWRFNLEEIDRWRLRGGPPLAPAAHDHAHAVAATSHRAKAAVFAADLGKLNQQVGLLAGAE